MGAAFVEEHCTGAEKHQWETLRTIPEQQGGQITGYLLGWR
jgi:hypothetical protein